MIEQSITLADGTVLQDSYCGYSSPDLWCFVKGLTMPECMQIFINSEKTAVIESRYYVKGYRYTGFTDLLLVQKSEDGVNIRLTWPEGGPHSVEEFDLETKTEETEEDQTTEQGR